MNSPDILAALHTALRDRRQVRLERRRIAAPNIYGLPLALGSDLVLLQVVDDFQLDGYVILRTADVTDVRSDEHERFSERILESEGISAGFMVPGIAIDLTTWQTALSSFVHRTDHLLILDCEEYEDEPMYVGVVRELDRERIGFQHVDALGLWTEDLDSIPYEDVTAVRFATRYSTLLNRHIPQPPASSSVP